MGARALTIFLSILLALLAPAALGQTQPKNLLQNPNADEGGEGWRFFFHDASLEYASDGDPHFSLRNSMQITQTVMLPEGSVGKYALLVARVSSDMIYNEGTRTGLPVMTATTMSKIAPEGNVATSSPGSLQWLPPATIHPSEWVALIGRFQIPGGTVAIQYTIARWDESARSRGPGPAVRFDDLGLYIFNTAEESEPFVKAYIRSLSKVGLKATGNQ